MQDFKLPTVTYCFFSSVGLNLLMFNLRVALEITCMIAPSGAVREVQYPLLNFIVMLDRPIYVIPQPYEYETTSNNFVADGYSV